MAAEPDLLPRLAGFARLLHDAGLEAGPARVTGAARALGEVDLRREDDFREALRAVFVSRRDDLDLFDAAFDLFWQPVDPRALPNLNAGRSRTLPLSEERARAWLEALGIERRDRDDEREGEPPASSGYSERELLRAKDFGSLTYDETQQVKRMLAQAPWRVSERRTRRLRAARSGAIDLRRTALGSIRSGGELVRLMHRRPRTRRRPLVLLCDVSGSMESYSRLLLVFGHAVGRRENLEAFVFSTRLTRITRTLRRRDPDLALNEVSRSVHDFSGGTRIGRAVGDFNRHWARRVLGHGAIVVIISDGWDRGDVGELEAEMARLHRSCHRLIWLNPLKGTEGYEPLTRGMAAALPHCDDFLSAHNLASLDDLGRLLAGLDRSTGRT